MGRPQSLHVSASRSGPRYTGVCDDCGFLFDYAVLQKQMEYRGNALCWTGALVCPTCLNRPREFLRPPLLGPEPIPPPLPRPTSYSIQNQGGDPPITSPVRLSIPGDEG